MRALTRIYAPSLLLCLFILPHCLDPFHGDNMTNIDQSVLACSHTFQVNDQSSTVTPHSPSTMLQLRCQRHFHRTYCRQQALRPTFNARLTLKRTFSLDFDFRKTFFHRPFDDSRAFFILGDYSTALFWMTPTRFDLKKTSVTTFTFLAVYFC